MSTLFSMASLETTDGSRLPGCRLARLEVLNWGTFDERIWTLDVGGRNALLTGDIGSGKSTLVDAVTTLLLPSQRISYNKAAGAATRERDLRSYVLGYYKSERNEATGASRPVGLRDARHYSVVLGVFHNTDYDTTVTLAQVFRTREGETGQPERFYVVSDDDLSIAEHFSDFGAEFRDLRRRLKGSGAVVADAFPSYGREFRRRLGIESEQAMELFHQTISMKAVDNLNDFVRSHMLEPFDVTKRIEGLVGHFDDLTRAHDAALRARAQLDMLEPIVGLLDEHGAHGAKLAVTRAQLAAAPYYFADIGRTRLRTEQSRLTEELEAMEAEVSSLEATLANKRRAERDLGIEIAGNGGDRLAFIESELERLALDKPRRRKQFDRFNGVLVDAGMESVTDSSQYQSRHSLAASRIEQLESDRAEARNEVTEARYIERQTSEEATEINAELRSLQSRRSNIPRQSLVLRDALCAELGLGEEDLPFAGELITVADGSSEWEGAAERVLHGFALSLLVPDQHYSSVAAWIDSHHLGMRVVYFAVPTRVREGRPMVRSDRFEHLADQLEIKPGTSFEAWLTVELERRADHCCVPSSADLATERKAVTPAGQIKDRQRHEKDDRHRIDDRSRYVLGWSNEAKIDALIASATAVAKKLAGYKSSIETVESVEAGLASQLSAVRRIDEFDSWEEMDWEAVVRQISSADAELAELKSTSDVLASLMAQRDALVDQIEELDDRLSGLNGQRGALGGKLDGLVSELERVERFLSDAEAVRTASESFPGLEKRANKKQFRSLDAPDLERGLTAFLNTRIDYQQSRQHGVAVRVERLMHGFRAAYPAESTEFDASVASDSDFRDLHSRVLNDDLPRFEAEFKESLNTNTIREIAQFSAQLHKYETQIRDRVDKINQSLTEIDFNPGRYVRLVPEKTPNVDVRQFQADLTACTDNIVGIADDQYSEQRFLQVKAIIDRFKGREGLTEADRAWTRRVTDVREWFVFSASERWRVSDEEYENYTDSAGKSGGQKEKLAYTILAASLAYQFKLDFGVAKSKAFRFVVIDEAFGRGSETSTRYALDLFTRLGLQMLIVTPLQKIHVIEPHVSAVGFVDNPGGNFSRLQGMTIEEFRTRRDEA